MDRRRRNLKFSYNTTTDQFKVHLRNENVQREDLETIRQAADGTRYHFVTGFKRIFSYAFDLANDELFDIFFDAFEAFQDGEDVTLSREKDDGTFEDVEVIVRRPVYGDETIGEDWKVFRNLSVEVLEI